LTEIWFDDIQHKLPLSAPERQAIAHWVATALTGEPAVAWPERLRVDERPRLVFLSLSDGRQPATVCWGSGWGLHAAVEAALARARQEPVAAAMRFCKIDIVQSTIACERLNLERPFKHERSLYGLAGDRASQIALLPEELVGQQLLDTEQRLDADRLARYLQARPQQAEAWARLRAASPVKFYRFACSSFATDGRDAWLLYRGHRCFNAIAPADLLAAATRGGDYLRRQQADDGRFTYCYYGSRDRVAIGYNLLRHAGAVSALLDLYEVTGELAWLDSAQGGLDYLLGFSQPSLLAPDVGQCIVEDGFAKLGTTALAAIAVAKFLRLARQDAWLPQLLQFARHLQAAQQPSGAFLAHRQTYPSGEETQFVSICYPSQALLALIYVYRATQRDSWLQRAEAAARYLLAIAPARDLDNYWLLCGLTELFACLGRADYRERAERLAAAVASRQHQAGYDRQPDWLGSFGQPPSATATAARLEGLCAVSQMTRLVARGDPSETLSDRDRRQEAIWLASRFLLQLQCEPTLTMYLPQPERACGGFRQHLDDFTLRLDDTYRSIASLLAAYRLTAVPIAQVARAN